MDQDRTTLIIFDWDDTLFPTTWAQGLGLLKDLTSIPTEEARQTLAEISESVSALLRQAQMHGLVIIVTNGVEGWVELTCRRFMPSCRSLFDTIPIVSARSTHELYTACPIEWKKRTFHAERGPATNIVSIGDSECERQAIASLLGPGRTVKSLKLDDSPSPEKLQAQLVMLRKIMDGIVLHTANIDIVCSSLFDGPLNGSTNLKNDTQ